jgi:hypothetical protein
MHGSLPAGSTSSPDPDACLLFPNATCQSLMTNGKGKHFLPIFRGCLFGEDRLI